MELSLDIHLADGYKSNAQRARRLTEGWFLKNMFCPACSANCLFQTSGNTKVVDFFCPECEAQYQLKSKAGTLGKKIHDAAYEPMIERIQANRSPHFAFLNYLQGTWRVQNLFIIPGYFFVPSVIERCRPLSPNARRSGWVGCNILAYKLPRDAFVPVIERERVLPKEIVRQQWKKFSWFASQAAQKREWTTDILRCLNQIEKARFELRDLYAFKHELSKQHPQNRNIEAKIRQQLQILRDKGILRFTGRGAYEMVKE